MAAPPRFYSEVPLAPHSDLLLPPGAARHVQVLRLQPGRAITLFDGLGGEYAAVVERMGRSEVAVRVEAHRDVEREPARAVHLAVALMASERMDWLIEKATELGAASIQPLLAERSMLRLAGERADKRVAHWQAIAIAACEQCGRNRLPAVAPLLTLSRWLAQRTEPGAGVLLALEPPVVPLREATQGAAALTLLSGPEGGLSADEESAATASGFARATLGPRVLRAETAPLAALSQLT
jgi:16S rRNA (uracil1498-N3)-methyltransferase